MVSQSQIGGIRICMRVAAALISVSWTFEPVVGYPTTPGHRVTVTSGLPQFDFPRFPQVPIYLPTLGKDEQLGELPPTVP